MLSLLSWIPGALMGFTNLILAAAETTPPDWVTYLLNGGPFAIVVFLMISDKITTTSERDRLRLENIALREEIKVLYESIRKDIVPPLVQVTGLMKDVIAELSERRGHYYPPDTKEPR